MLFIRLNRNLLELFFYLSCKRDVDTCRTVLYSYLYKKERVSLANNQYILCVYFNYKLTPSISHHTRRRTFRSPLIITRAHSALGFALMRQSRPREGDKQGGRKLFDIDRGLWHTIFASLSLTNTLSLFLICLYASALYTHARSLFNGI